MKSRGKAKKPVTLTSNGEISDKNGKFVKENSVGLSGDWGNIFVLTFLYVLQGIPLGLAGAIPMILQNRHITYKEQAIFSFVHWPFSLKLLWAPIVDTIYSEKVGRRKSWLVPTQYLIGAFMLGLSSTVDELFGFGFTDKRPNVTLITAVFFILCFLAATQDIAVDGWALTMLAKRNVGHASTCNCIGQSAGYFIGLVIFLALESADFCNSYLRSEPKAVGMVTLSEFLYFWGFVYFISTTLVWLLKHEKSSHEESGDHLDQNVAEAYVSLAKIIKLPSIRLLIIFLLTLRVGFAAPDTITGLKLSEQGVPKEKLAFLAIPLIPLQILLPIFISRFTAGPKPLNVMVKAYPFRLLFGLFYPLLVSTTSLMKTASSGEFPYYYYIIVLVCYALHQVAVYSIFVSIMGFFAKISDPAIGGTYMTLLNTLSNLGGNWPATVALWFVDSLTWKDCVGGNSNSKCDTDEAEMMCVSGGGQCEVVVDGYYVECCICTVFGIVWLLVWGRHWVHQMQSVPETAWRTNNMKHIL
ncbi:hypothetical protein CHUAL_000132 [Chamberlinius hualienensis]